ncbi:MAG TPA: ABC transporter ATP-binding protein [Pseudomonadales bacterium]
MTTQLHVNAITCRYGAKQIFADLSFRVDDGSIACLLGPSGCGKTTALRAIAGFEPVYAGSIELGGRTLSAPGLTLPPEQRQVGMVFQDYALFPHLTVADNIAFGLNTRTSHGKTTSNEKNTRHAKLTRHEKDRITGELLDLIRLQDLAKSYPHQLSGGQQQRVALARALAPRPQLLLLDEPFSNLDTELRRSLSLEVRTILKQYGTTAILVTHDQTEAFNVADAIGVMADGKLLQWGSARELYHEPATPFVAAFVSNGSFVGGQVVAPQRLATPFGEVSVEATGLQPGQAVDLLLRPWNVVRRDGGSCTAKIVSQQFQGASTLTSLELADGTILVSLDEHLSTAAAGSSVTLALDPRHLRVFPR